jgi:zinc D-Ala-D-Ala carboxypeptidase
VSGYRSAAYQQRLWDLGRCRDALCAPPGYSEHQLGLSVDLFDASTDQIYMKNGSYARYISWLRAHAHLYGWHESYQNGESIDAYQKEPWHWRYLGIELATRLKKLDMSYTEYVRFEKVLKFWRKY